MVSIERVRARAAFGHLHRLLVEYEHDLPPDLRHGREPALPEVEALYDGERAAAFLARIDGAYGGCVAVRALTTPSAVLQRLYVRPDYRGKGAARSLALAAVEYARERGCRRIVLDTQAQRLSAAYNLYVALGFVECEPFEPVDYAAPTYMELKLH
ncbi:MAG TPA: GNAT family N-acetyltransferase [Candidatus Baltobacteraceae bacterium]|nr:GNAT family N-acetyltransferase [Candidatus Baltobacteraceae bacterium]